jgi:sugar lactone lactonase YvrE
MQVPNGRNTSLRRAAILGNLICLLIALSVLSGCSGPGSTSGGTNPPPPTHFLLVSDSGTNRVVVYPSPFSNGMNAATVLGQASFTTSAAVLTASGMSAPAEAIEDSSGNVWVTDQLKNRVLQFKAPLSNGMNASVVIGQPDFVTGTANTTQNGLSGPVGMAFDASGNLWVADLGNNRVLEYQPPFATHMNASVVLGQPDFTSVNFVTTSSGLVTPFFVAFDASGDLWVSDTGNNRVLEFKPPFVNGMGASLVVGQPDFVSGASATTASTLNFPTGIALDGSGNLWVGDTTNNRVLEFQPAFATGMSASLVLGQANFTSSSTATTQNGFFNPFGVGFDSSGNLGVADFGNNRTLGFAPPFSTNMNAGLVLGQPNFTSSVTAATSASEISPIAVSAATGTH